MVWALPCSLAATEGIEFLSLPPVTEMFHFTGFASDVLLLTSYVGYMKFFHVGYPIGISPGQCLLGSFPGLIAAGHVRHRLPLPRRPPSALGNLYATGCLLMSFDLSKTMPSIGR